MEDPNAFYDTKIAPLVREIHELCGQANIPFLAVYQLPDEVNAEGQDAEHFAASARVTPGSSLTLQVMALVADAPAHFVHLVANIAQQTGIVDEVQARIEARNGFAEVGA